MTAVVSVVLFLAAGFIFVCVRRLRRSVPENIELSPWVTTNEISLFSVSKKSRKHRCGHIGPRFFRIFVYGLSVEEDKCDGRCHRCSVDYFNDTVIRCGYCKEPIFAGSPIALYAEESEGWNEDVAVRVEDQFIGCLNTHCCPTGAFFAGHWSGSEFKPYFKGGGTIASETFRSGEAQYTSLD